MRAIVILQKVMKKSSLFLILFLAVFYTSAQTKVIWEPDVYKANLPGTKLLTAAEAAKALQKGTGLDSLYGSLAVANKFNLDNKVYKESQKAESYIAPSIVQSLTKK